MSDNKRLQPTENSFNNSFRKRKYSNVTNGKENHPCAKIGVKWAVNTAEIADILTDMGVGVLDDQSNFSDSSEQTSASTVSSTCSNVRTPSTSHNNAESSDVYSVISESSPDTDSNNCFLRRRRRRSYRQDHSSKISDEVILSIFKWLPKKVLVVCAQTCKRWRRLAFDETLWKKVDASRKQLNDGDVGRILLRGVQALRLAVAEISTPVFASSPMCDGQPFLSRLRLLDLSMAAITVVGLSQILAVCTELRKLSLENCDVDETVCTAIGQNKSLHTLNMCLCRGLTTNGIQRITSNCKSIQELNVAWTDMSAETVTCLVQTLPMTMHKVNLSGLRLTLNDDAIEDLSVSCPDLTDLDISDCCNLTSATMHLITDRMLQLKCLSVNRCYSVPINDYLLLKHMKTLQKLEIYGLLNSESLATLRNSLKNVQVNKRLFSTIARPTTGLSRSSIWGVKVRN